MVFKVEVCGTVSEINALFMILVEKNKTEAILNSVKSVLCRGKSFSSHICTFHL